MKFALRFVIPLLLVMGVVLYAMGPAIDSLQERWFARDLRERADAIAQKASLSVLSSLGAGDLKSLKGYLSELVKEERLMAAAICTLQGQISVASEQFPAEIQCQEGLADVGTSHQVHQLPTGKIHVTYTDIHYQRVKLVRLALIQDMSFLTHRGKDARWFILATFIILGVTLSVLMVLTVQLSWKQSVRVMGHLIRTFRGEVEEIKGPLGLYKPVVRDLRKLVRDLESRRSVRDETMLSWRPKTLKDILHDELSDEQVIIVANRTPLRYVKNKKGGVEAHRPASGLVTALEPIVEACSGVWIGQSSGDADREMADHHGRIRISSPQPYFIRPVWLTPEEERGYYFGFANEGLWPLCHIAHTRPIFRSEDYEQYKKVNQMFADAVVREARSDEPVILIQDYHFALLPALIRKKLPNAVIITFWHIPWPNPEAFGICPWREELLEGLLGSSIMGFHTQFHCNNFFDTVDRYLESRIDREQSAISHLGELTGVRPYPISIEWPPKWLAGQPSIRECRRLVREELGLPMDVSLGLGVDRLDYTKGIVERFLSVDRLLKIHPEWVGKFSFVQIAAPSRSELPSYMALYKQVEDLAQEINSRFESQGVKPIILRIAHHEPSDVYRYFRAAELCYVSSLHDGMNLVAKEYVAARDDEQGCLVLSSFTGASRELPEALIVNPYDIDQTAESLHTALKMSEREQRERMKSMRSVIREYNVYRWAGRMLLDAGHIKRRNKFSRRFSRHSLERGSPLNA